MLHSYFSSPPKPPIGGTVPGRRAGSAAARRSAQGNGNDNIALVNELAMVAHELGINVWESLDATATKPFGYMPFTPGPGVGGHCLPIDPAYLSWRVERTLGKSFRFVELADDINRHMPDYVVHRLMLAFNMRGRPLSGAQILLLGLAHKRNTGDARESPAVRVS